MESLLYVYVASLLVGGVVVVMSVLGGMGADVDVDAGAGGATADVEAGGEFSLLAVMKIRRLFYFAFFFGLTGLLGGLTMGRASTLLVALGTGSGCAWLGDWIISRVAESSASSGLQPDDYVGMEGRVTVPLKVGGQGKVSGVLNGRTVELVAQAAADDMELEPGDQVLVLELREGVALVDKQ
jgi:hypothetical protein